MGGWKNEILTGSTYQHTHAFIGGGISNVIKANDSLGLNTYGSLVGGGIGNNTYGGTWNGTLVCFTAAPTQTKTGSHNTLLGGFQNQISSGSSKFHIWDTLLGGYKNIISHTDGGLGNFLGGGNQNKICVTNTYTSIGGGSLNVICAPSTTSASSQSVIGGGISNIIKSSINSVILGGCQNCISRNGGTINYGADNVIGGGRCNTMNGNLYSGGCGNFIAGGYCNSINFGGGWKHSSILGGQCNSLLTTGGANYGCYSSILGGLNTICPAAGCGCNVHSWGYGITCSLNNYFYTNNAYAYGGGISDCRIKIGICNNPYGLSHVDKLKPVTFKFSKNPDRTRYGFLAQEVQEIIPSSIFTVPTHRIVCGEEYWDPKREKGEPALHLEYDAIWVSYINSIKELKSCLISIENEINLLETN